MVVVFVESDGGRHPIAASFLKIHTNTIIPLAASPWPTLEDIPTHIRGVRA